MKQHKICATITENEFMLRLLLNVQPIIQKRYAECYNVEQRTTKPVSLSPVARYHIDVFYRAVAIINTAERMANCLTFMHRFPSPKKYKEQSIGYHTWLEYHYSYYVISLVSLYDAALILTNKVFCLGNKDKNCKPEIIKSNDNVRGTSTKVVLDVLDKYVSKYRNTRNVHVHQGHVPDIPSMVSSDSLQTFMLASQLSLFQSQTVPQAQLKSMFQEEIEQIIVNLSSELDALQNTIIDFFNSLLPVYIKFASALEQKDSN